MALAAAYQKFLSNPSTSALAPSASINYIPTLTSIHEPTAILKHLAAQTKAIKKKSEKTLNVIESGSQLCAEYETVLEIVSSGGAYLPGLDDNFLVDKTVTLPIIHIVNFDRSNNITSIRLHWDQASLLKQVDVIGARARNWPIRDGKDQTKLISSIVTGSQEASQQTTGASTDGASSTRSHASSNASNYTTSSIFQGSNIGREDGGSFNGNTVSPRSAAKPVSRDLADILSGAANTLPTSPIGSPLKDTFGLGGNQRIGAEKHFQPIRLFDENAKGSSDNAPDIKTNPKKFNHFEFADSDESTPLQSAPLTAATKPVNRIKHQSQWDFADFTTPEKPKASAIHNQVRNVGWSDDEPETPMQRPIVHKARPDADVHFEFKDDGTPKNPHTRNFSKGRAHNEGLRLYQDNIMDNDNETKTGNSTSTATKNPLVELAGPHVNASSRHNTFDRTESPISSLPSRLAQPKKGLTSSWDLYDESPAKENRGIKTQGNGMGGRSNARNPLSWGDDDEDTPVGNPNAIKTQGNGMGGQKGLTRSWDVYDDSAEF